MKLHKFHNDDRINAKRAQAAKLAKSRESAYKVELNPMPTCLLVTDTKGKTHRVLFERWDDGPQFV
jgi:hypothetical protein